MATIVTTNTHPQFPALNLGNIDARQVTLTYSGNYATNGDVYLPANVSLSGIIAVYFSIRSSNGGTAVLAAYNYTTGAIQLFAGAAAGVKFAELTNATATAGIVIDALFLGTP